MAKDISNEVFKCPSCSGDMHFDPKTKRMHCNVCDRDEAVKAVDEEMVEYNFDTDEADEFLRDWGTDVKTAECGSCGGKMVVPANETASKCAFCGERLMEESEDTLGIRPESLIPFKVDFVKAMAILSKFAKRRIFAPFAFKREFNKDDIKGVFIPYWSYEAETRSIYTGQAGDHYHTTEMVTETVDGKTQTRSKRVRKTRWRFVSGTYDKAFGDIMFSDSGNINKKMIERIEPYKLNELVDYEPRYLTGFSVEQYDNGLKAVWERAQKYMGAVVRTDITAMIKRGCDEVGRLNISTRYTDIRYKQMLLPLWISSYVYRKKTYNIYINGQTGELHGKMPKSVIKLCGLILALLGIAAALYFILT